jgi:hypothetical protein
MTEKPSPPFRIAPLQRLAAEPITDPAEQAALDEQRKRSAERRPAVRTRGGAPSPDSITFTELVDLVQQLPVDDRLLLVEHLLGQLPTDALRHLEEQLRGQLGGE